MRMLFLAFTMLIAYSLQAQKDVETLKRIVALHQATIQSLKDIIPVGSIVGWAGEKALKGWLI